MHQLLRRIIHTSKAMLSPKHPVSGELYESSAPEHERWRYGYVANLDSPKALPDSGRVHINGWVVAPSTIKNVTFEGIPNSGIKLVSRIDVERFYSAAPSHIGFEAEIDRSEIKNSTITLRIETDEATHLWMFPFALEKSERSGFKTGKLERFRDRLQCPRCTGSIMLGPDGARCEKCSELFESSNHQINFLPEDIKKEFKIVSTANISANDYDEYAISIIQRYADGVVLDCGAGYRAVEYPNVINFEIVPYPSTDVIGVNERLPFKDNTFDAVFSLAVLEHVKDPFASAAEIMRVLKPGGTLYSVVPFLQPLHGYPHHYYNMTHTGLANLFSKEIEIEQYGVLKSGLPIWSLTWMLRNWIDGLGGSAREHFMNMKVADLIGEPASYLNADFVTELSEKKNLELASTTMIVGKKRGLGKDSGRQ